MTLAYAINGLNLHDVANGRRLLDAPVWTGNMSMRNYSFSMPGVHGQVPLWNTYMDASSILFKVRIFDTSEDGLNTKWNNLVRHLGVGINQPSVIARTRSTTDTLTGKYTTTQAQLISIEAPDFSCTPGMVTATLSYNVPSGRWYGPSTDQVLSLTAANQRVTAAEAGTLPITDAQFLVKGPISGLHIFDNVSQTGFDWTGPVVSSAQWLLVDLVSFTAWVKASATYTLSGTNVSAGLANSGVGWLSLVPGVTATGTLSSVSVTSSGTSGASTLTLRAQSAYH